MVVQMYLTNIYVGLLKILFFFYTRQQYKCKCKKLKYVNRNDLFLHNIYTPYIRLLTLTYTTLVNKSEGPYVGLRPHRFPPPLWGIGGLGTCEGHRKCLPFIHT